MSVGFGFSLPALAQYGGGGNNPFGQLGPTLDLSFAGTVTDTGDPNGYTLNTNFIAPQYQVAADYTIWETNVGLVSKAFGDIITFTRASSATFTGSNGLIQSATTNTPRFDYDPVTLAAKGLLIEEQRTNLLTYSEQFDNAAWSKVNTTVTADASVAPDGTTTADKLIANITLDQHRCDQTPSSTAVAQTFSVYAKAAGYGFVGLRLNLTGALFDLSTGATSNVSAGITAQSTSVGNGWYRCSITKATGVANDVCRINISDGSAVAPNFTGNGTDGIFIWGAQLEAGAFATSYIPTVASQVTRSADVASVNTLSPWYNATEGTLYAEIIPASPINNSQPQILWDLNDGTANNRTRVFRLPTSGTGVLSVTTGGASQVTNLGTGVLAQNSISKTAAAYKTNDFAEVNNSGTVSTTSSGTVSTASALRIGDAYSGNTTINGHIRRITYYPRRLSNAELVSITT